MSKNVKKYFLFLAEVSMFSHCLHLEDYIITLSTGLISWQGASCLLDWAEWSGRLDGKTVLELGEGFRNFINKTKYFRIRLSDEV